MQWSQKAHGPNPSSPEINELDINCIPQFIIIICGVCQYIKWAGWYDIITILYKIISSLRKLNSTSCHYSMCILMFTAFWIKPKGMRQHISFSLSDFPVAGVDKAVALTTVANSIILS